MRTPLLTGALLATVLAAVLAGCASPAPSDQALPAAAGEAYLVSFHDDPAPGVGVVVEAVDPAGRVRPVASLPGIRPAGWDDASASLTFQPSIGPTGMLALGVERNGGFEDADVRTLLIDLTSPARPPIEIGGAMYQPFWGPSGELASLDGEPVVIDPVTARRHDLPRLDNVEIAAAWLRDGSGWLASKLETEASIPGSLSRDGRFTPGPAAAFEVTGRERQLGSAGGSLSLSISDGATQSETAIVEVRPDLGGACKCAVWVRSIEPGDDPSFGEPVWDHDGDGVWVVFSDDETQWLSHMDAPLKESRIADLPPGASWRVEGISADDRWIILGDFNGGGPLLLVDTASGESRVLARPDAAGNAPMFAGWVR